MAEHADTACPVCSSNDTAERWELGDRLMRTTDRRFRIRECEECRARFIAPQPAPRDLAAFYPTNYWEGPADSEQNRGLRGRLIALYRRLMLFDQLRFVRRVYDEQVARGADVRILDAGCGDGSFLDALDRQPCFGMDISELAVRAARSRGQSVVCGQLRDPPFAPGRFSLITLFHVIEHVHPVDAFLEGAKTLLAPGGDLVVQVPNGASWQARIFGRSWTGLDVPRHLVTYDPASLRRKLAQNGFEVVRETHFSIRDNPTAVAASVLPGLYPPARIARGGKPGGGLAWLADLTFLAATAAAVPFTLLESAFGRGGAIMVQARVAE